MKSFITFLIAVLLVTAAFAAQPTPSAYAGATPNPTPAPTPASSDVEVTGYSVARGGQLNTGSILKGDVVDVTVNIRDTRAEAIGQTPQVALNTASFSLWSSNDISIHPPGPTADGQYALVFHNTVYTGTGTAFDFDVWYQGSGLPKESVTLTLNQCVPYVEPEKKPDNTVTKGTGFVLKDARYADGQTVYAGEAFTLSAVILATNGDVPVENVTVSFAPPEKLTLAEGSSVAYVGTMRPGQSVPVSVNLFPGASIEEGTYTVNIDISGINQKTGEAVTATAKVSVPILQPERFEIFNAQLPSDLTAGVDDGMGYASITLVNKGKGTVANVSVEITGSGLTTSEGKQYIGNVAPGEQKSSDFNLHAEAPGQIDGMVTVTYENARGEEKTLERGFAVNVNEAPEAEPMPGDGGEMPPEEPAGPPRWVWIAAAAAVVIVVVIILARRARKKKKASEEAYLDDDEDDL